MINDHKTKRINLATLGVVLGTLLTGGLSLHAQTDVQKLEQENQDLKKRLDAMEDLMKKEGLQPSGDTEVSPVKAMSAITISGFVTSSYFYDLANSKDNAPTSYLWNTHMNSFTVNKVKLTLASPAVDKDKWDASYKVSLLYGEDAPIDNSSFAVAGYSAIREAYLDLNVPVGTGLDIRMGEFTSLLNYESGDGGAVNDNFSQGYQWYYTGNGPAAGIQASYDFSDMVSAKLRLQNGLYAGEVGTGPKTLMGGLYINPDKKTTLSFIGFGGDQGPGLWMDGASFIGTRKLTDMDNLNFATEIDYFDYSFSNGGKSENFWSVGGWLTGDLMAKTTWALRADFMDDPTGFGSGAPNPSGPATQFPGVILGGAGQELSSVTLTLNWKPTATVKIQPEIRWDHSDSSHGALNGKSDQIIAGFGASYMF